MQEEQRHRLADDVAAPDHDGPGALERHVVLLEQGHDPHGSGSDVRRPAQRELAEVQRMEPVDVLPRVDRTEHTRLVDLVRERQLDEKTIDRVVRVQLLDLLEQLFLGRL